MSQITPRLIYQVNLPKSLEIEEDYYSPIFGINNMFWQIFILRNDNQITELYSRSFVIPPGTHIDNGVSISHLDLTDELTISNVSEIMLKKPILNFMAINFEDLKRI
ncbi:hypothetical protein RhiirA1_535124 [Rhizophagus irregularis]|uniref:Uncharacterized protein n=1 Tax=Rhizophagus irregularis TaxID=588596 RepID=A0A2N0RUY5_9GLOM|nr:hypothetical protein RhiirA1_535124 [Rhizophagus irregularis]